MKLVCCFIAPVVNVDNAVMYESKGISSVYFRVTTL